MLQAQGRLRRRNSPFVSLYVGHFQFLTIDGLWLTIVTCLLGGLGEMIPGVSSKHRVLATEFR